MRPVEEELSGDVQGVLFEPPRHDGLGQSVRL